MEGDFFIKNLYLNPILYKLSYKKRVFSGSYRRVSDIIVLKYNMNGQ